MRKLTRLAIIGGASTLALALSHRRLPPSRHDWTSRCRTASTPPAPVRIHTSVGRRTRRPPVWSSTRRSASARTAGLRARSSARPMRESGPATSAAPSFPVPGDIEVRAPTGTALVSGVAVPLAQLARPARARRRTPPTGCSSSRQPATRSSWRRSSTSRPARSRRWGRRRSRSACLRTTSRPARPGRSPLGIKLVDAVLTFNRGIFTNPSSAGVYLWTSIWTPYNPGVGTPNAAGTVSAISATALPITLSLKGTYREGDEVGDA